MPFCGLLPIPWRLALARKKTTIKKVTKKNVLPPRKSQDIPVSKRHLDEFRAELKSDSTSMDLKVGSLHSRMDSFESRMDSLESRVTSIDLKVDSLRSEMNSRFEKVDSKIEKLVAVVHRTNALIEAQEDRNRYVLDGYTSLSDRLDKVEKKVFDEKF